MTNITRFISRTLHSQGRYLMDFSPNPTKDEKGEFFRVVFNSPILTDKIIDDLVASIVSVGAAYQKKMGQLKNQIACCYLQKLTLIFQYEVQIQSPDNFCNSNLAQTVGSDRDYFTFNFMARFYNQSERQKERGNVTFMQLCVFIYVFHSFSVTKVRITKPSGVQQGIMLDVATLRFSREGCTGPRLQHGGET